MMAAATRRSLLAVAMLCGSAGASFAQLAPSMSTGTPRQPGLRTAAPAPGLATLTPLGGIQLSLGNLGVPGQLGALGAIGSCAAPGIATSPTSAPSTAALDAANGIIPAVPAVAAPAFGTLSLSSVCNPILPGAPADATAAPDPNAAAAFTDGAVPLSATESGSPGFSPSIVVPGPSDVSAVGLSSTGSAVADQLVTLQPPAISSSGCAGDAACGGAP
jgi:hypothetical protein